MTGIKNTTNHHWERRVVLSVLGVLVLAGCATPARHTTARMIEYDKDTEYAVEGRPDGFTVSIYYSKYQFIPESAVVSTSCKSMLTSIVYEVAEKLGQQIQPINDHKIRVSVARYALLGITSCEASTTVDYKR